MIDRENDRKKAEGKKLAGSPPKRYPPSPIIALSAVVSVKSCGIRTPRGSCFFSYFCPEDVACVAPQGLSQSSPWKHFPPGMVGMVWVCIVWPPAVSYKN